MNRNKYTPRENNLMLDKLVPWLLAHPGSVPSTHLKTEWSASIIQAEGDQNRHSQVGWEKKFSDAVSCTKVPLTRKYGDKPAGSPRTPTRGATASTVGGGPSTQEMLLARLAAPLPSLADARKDVTVAWQLLGDALETYLDALERTR